MKTILTSNVYNVYKVYLIKSYLFWLSISVYNKTPMNFDIKQLDGQWHYLIHEFTGYSPTIKPGQPCPVCSSDAKSDRFHYTNKHNNGTWLCRQCTPEGSDGIGLIAKLNHEDRKEVYKKIARKYDNGNFKKYPKAEPEPEFIPVPTNEIWDGKTIANKDRVYKFNYIWKWNDPDGSLYGYVTRLEWVDKDTNEGKKVPWQIKYGAYDSGEYTQPGWYQVAMNPKPLFGYPSCGLEQIKAKRVLIVEGEKTCMAAKQLLGPDYLVLCCQGGSSNVFTSDLIPIAELNLPITVMGDFDEAGDKYEDNLVKAFGDLGINIQVVNKKEFSDRPQGWDLADVKDPTESDIEFIKNIINDHSYERIITEMIKEIPAEDRPSLPVEKPAKDNFDPLLKHVNPLGIFEGKYVFYPKNLKYVMFYQAGAMLQAANMISIIGEDYLNKYFSRVDPETGETSGYNCTAAGKYLMDQCHKRGPYDPDQMRGVGVWRDKKQTVVNTGIALVVDGEKKEYDDFKSHYTYSQAGSEKVSLDRTLTTEQLEIVKKIIYGFNWAKPYHAHLMLGALVQAPIGSAFRWRAHTWLIGAQGTGKSTLQSGFIRKLLGNLCINFGGETTAAGVRQALKNNPFTVSFDEAEVRSEKDAKRMKDIISLARISSSDDNNVVKGSASGDAMEYRCQSSFIMSSIKPFLKEESDLARFSLLELVKPDKSLAERENFAEVQKLCLQIDEDFSQGWNATCIMSLPEIEKSMIPIKETLLDRGFDSRTADQYGQLIACAKMVNPDINLADINETLEEAGELTADREPFRELSRLLNNDIRIHSKFGDRTVTLRKAIDLASKTFVHDDEIDVDEILERLAKYGLKIHRSNLYIANNNSEIEKILGYTDWNKLFKIIDEAEVGAHPTTFGSSDQRCRYVKIPLNIILYSSSSDEDFNQF